MTKKLCSTLLVLHPSADPIRIELWSTDYGNDHLMFTVKKNDFIVTDTDHYELARRTYVKVVDAAMS